MNTDTERVLAYYERFPEWERLDSVSGRLEFRRSCQMLDRHLPPRSRVLDLGGGPGRYALYLAARGHRVVLADVSAALLATARRKVAESDLSERIEGIDEADARDLSRYSNDSFDAVVAFGPFYHLLSEGERIAAAKEVLRVLRPGGLAFIAFIPRLSGIAGLLDRAARNPDQVPPGALSQLASTGIFRSGSDAGFQEGYYPHPEELQHLLEARGFEAVETRSLRGVANMIEGALATLEGPVAEEASELLESLSGDPAVVATGGHAVTVAKRP